MSLASAYGASCFIPGVVQVFPSRRVNMATLPFLPGNSFTDPTVRYRIDALLTHLYDSIHSETAISSQSDAQVHERLRSAEKTRSRRRRRAAAFHRDQPGRTGSSADQSGPHVRPSAARTATRLRSRSCGFR